MAPLNDRNWSEDPAENEALAEVQMAMRAMAQSLYAVREADYVDPAGGFTPGV